MTSLVAPKVRVDGTVETLHGRRISDPYRWLENGETPETQNFVREQLAYARSLLDPLKGRDRIHQRLTELLSIGMIGTPQVAGRHYFYSRRDGTQNQPILYVREGVSGKDRALVDPNQMARDGTVAIDWFYPARDGKNVAYGLSAGGSEMSTLQVIETATGELLPDLIERTRAASVAWKLDGSGFFYTRYPTKGAVPDREVMYHRRVFYHALRTEAEQDPLIFAARHPEDWPNVDLSEDGRWLLITVEQGWTRTELYLVDVAAAGAAVRITDGKDFVYRGEVFRGELYILSNEDAPRYRVFKGTAERPGREFWREVVPQSEAVLQNIDIIHRELFALYEREAISEIRVFGLEGEFRGQVKLPGLGSVTGFGGEWDSGEMFFGFQSFTVPSTVYRIDLTKAAEGTGFPAPTVWARIDAPGIDPADYEVKQVWYRSKDDTRVPMFIVHRKGLPLNGSNPTLLSGYGGFNISLTPTFSGDRYLWLQRGGVFAVANLRGGGEFGEEWHRGGMLDKKQNVFDDFIAAAEYLIAEKYTDRAHLAIRGGSNGGLLMGAVLTQRPDLFRAVVCQVPLLDMLRYQDFQIAKLWIPEYGSAEDPQQFEWLYAYSPYHHVKAGVEYPAVLFMTAESDTRVDPLHAKKMAARLQAEAANGKSAERPILLRIEPKAGHGVGKPVTKVIEEATDMYSFLFWQLGVD